MNVLRYVFKTACPIYSQLYGPTITSSSLLINRHHRCFHLTTRNHDLMDFFDDSENWGKSDIKHGRAWKQDELRIKSNVDLHKLWYVLLKEKNMLLTMQHDCKRNVQLFPSPERIDKVEESMENLENVVRERNQAYYYLETGKTGERPVKSYIDAFGNNVQYRAKQHVIPEKMNTSYRQRYLKFKMDEYAYEYQSLMLEQRIKLKGKERNRQRNHVTGLLKRFEDVDEQAIRENFPEVNLRKVKEKTAGRITLNWKGRQP